MEDSQSAIAALTLNRWWMPGPVGPLLPMAAKAQEALPPRIVFPFAPGGAADAIARLLAEDLRPRLGRPVIVVNTGGGGRIGAQAVKAAPPDGSTLLLAAATQMVLQPHTDAAIGYDPVAAFRPVAQVMRFGQVIAIGPDNPARRPAALIAWSGADGTGAHDAGLDFGRIGGVAPEHAAYRGTPAAIPDLRWEQRDGPRLRPWRCGTRNPLPPRRRFRLHRTTVVDLQQPARLISEVR